MREKILGTMKNYGVLRQFGKPGRTAPHGSQFEPWSTLPNPYIRNRASPAAEPIATRLVTLTSFSLPRLDFLTSNIPKQLDIR